MNDICMICFTLIFQSIGISKKNAYRQKKIIQNIYKKQYLSFIRALNKKISIKNKEVIPKFIISEDAKFPKAI